MAKGSQLSQLKSALSDAGLQRQSASKKKKRSGATSRDIDKIKKAKKIQEIHEKLNPFELKITKLKHDVGGRKLKGVVGKPQQSKQAGLEQRKKTLLKEYRQKDHVGGVIDRRFGENDPTMTPEERMLERFTRERQRSSRGVAFNLEDEDELTHYGQSLSKLDDFDDVGLGLDKDDDDESDGKIDSETVKRAHFGGFEDDETEGGDEKSEIKKSKAEVMAEVIAKSKAHKAQRQLERQQDDETRHQLDMELDDIRGLLFSKPKEGPEDNLSKAEQDADYDQNVRELALDARAQPKDRTKTEEELAIEAKEALEKAERKRLKRMLGEDDDSSDEEGGRKKARKEAGGDDLEDDFQGDEDWTGLGAGLEANDRNSDSEGHTDDEDEDEEFDSDGGMAVAVDDDDDGDEGQDSEDEDEESDAEDLSNKRANSSRSKPQPPAELPFTFPCPESHDDFLNIVENLKDEDIPTVVQRIRTLYHPSLGQDNKYKLQAFTGVLVDYILYITSPPTPRFNVFLSILPHLQALSTSYPIESANHFNSKLKLMQKNLVRGLSRGATSLESKTWPGIPELSLLLTISHVWPTSDMNHAVVNPARLLMGSFLGLCRVRSLQDLASGLFICTIFLKYESFSKRFIPEVPAFLSNAILHLVPHSYNTPDSVPGSFPCPDLNSELCRPLRISKKLAKNLSPAKPKLIELMLETESEKQVMQAKIDLLALALEILRRTADMYKALEGFIEVFEPLLQILGSLSLQWASEDLKSKFSMLSDTLQRLVKFAHQSRRPLMLQAHKPIPIASYIPKFESHSSTYLRKQDPDYERAQASKLRYQYKQERKGAIRELRKDARFLSSVQHKEQMEKDAAYSKRMKQVFGSLESEQAEQKKMDREKSREKKRAGKK